jgi:hypothetical protein
MGDAWANLAFGILSVALLVWLIRSFFRVRRK